MSTSEVEREDREDLVAVERVAVPVDREHPVAVAVERDAEIEALARGRAAWSARRSVAPQPTLMFVPSGSIADRGHLGAELLEGARARSTEYAPFAQSTPMRRPVEVGAEALEDVVEVAVDGDLEVVDLAALRVLRRRVEQRLDRLLVRVGELAAVLA